MSTIVNVPGFTLGKVGVHLGYILRYDSPSASITPTKTSATIRAPASPKRSPFCHDRLPRAIVPQVTLRSCSSVRGKRLAARVHRHLAQLMLPSRACDAERARDVLTSRDH